MKDDKRGCPFYKSTNTAVILDKSTFDGQVHIKM